MPRLPLFPLNVVLFPGMLLPLHIFEERYKAMVNDCVKGGGPFGVVLVPEDEQKREIMPYYNVGTMAYITEVERLENGRMNIIVLGRQRFVVGEVVQHEPYLVAEVENYPMDKTQGRATADQVEATRQRMNRVRGLLPGYLDLLGQNVGQVITLGRMPSGLASLAYLVAIVLQISLEEKQALLEMPSYGNLLRQEETILRRESLLLQYIIETGDRPKQGAWPHPPAITAN